MELKILSILIGILGAIIGVYFKESFRQSKKQKIIASKLESYILLTMRALSKEPFISFLVVGKKWSDEYKNSYKQYGKKGINKVQKKIDTEKNEIIERIKSADTEVIEDFKKDCLKIQGYDEKIIYHMLAEITKFKTQIIDNKVFISDDEAAELPENYTYQCISYKSEILNLLNSVSSLVLEYRKMKEFNYSLISNNIIVLVLSLLNISQKQFPLLLYAQKLKNTRTAKLTLKNMFS